ncbi:MAG: hypothetical protein HY908_37205 [Myxococcales bacterium]|nr:hypothetical protein [Myxococcales bacterium]
MQFKPFEAGVEVNGQTVYAIVDGFKMFKRIPSQILLAEGIGQLGANDVVQIDPLAWYSQAAWLRAFERIAKEVGTIHLYAIGAKIPENAKFPPSVTDVATAIQAIDVAYHMNHRAGGRVLFDAVTGRMYEGIGHYGFAQPGPRHIVSRCENPYPCDFDRGIITTMARRFEKTALIEHDDSQPCRQRGDDSCTYSVTW